MNWYNNENIVGALILIGVIWSFAGFFYFGAKMSGPVNSLKPSPKPIKLLVLVAICGPFMWAVGAWVGMWYLLLIWPLQAFFKRFPQILNAFKRFDKWLEV